MEKTLIDIKVILQAGKKYTVFVQTSLGPILNRQIR